MTAVAPTTTTIPNYRAGTWAIDPAHSEVSFSVRHMMVSKVRGTFREFEGSITTGEDPRESSVSALIQVGSVDTRNDARDGHLRTNDFFDVPNHPTMEFRSSRVDLDALTVTGELTLKGVTKEVTLAVEDFGVVTDAYGFERLGLSATGSLNRNDFGVDISMPLQGGGVVVGDKITINLDVEAVLNVEDSEEAAQEGKEATESAL